MWPLGKKAAAPPTHNPFIDPAPAETGRKSWGWLARGAFAGAITFSIIGLLWLTSEPPAKPQRTVADRQSNTGEVPGSWQPPRREAAVDPVTAAASNPADFGGELPRFGNTTRTQTTRRVVSRVPIATFQAPLVALPGPSGSLVQPATTADPATVAAADRMRREAGGGATGDALTDRLAAGTDQMTAVASMLPDRDLFVTAYSPLACTMEGGLNTDQPGPFRCAVRNAPVKCSSGDVDCLPIGTWFGGTTQPLSRGQRRAFAVIRRIQTPSGCIVNLRAPMATADGQAGLDGDVDTHFFERFRGLAAVALMDAASQAAAVTAAQALTGGGGGGGNFYQFQGAGRQLGQGTFGDDMNIPPTLTAPPARRALVMLMQDIDMRPCIQLRARN